MKKTIIAKSIGLYFNILAYVFPNKTKKDGFVLFCSPFARKIKPHHLDFLDTGKAENIVVDGAKIQTYRWGTGTKKVLLLHGWASHSFRWKNYINTLIENDFSVFAIDAPAHGQSEGKILNVVLYKNAIEAFLNKNPDVESIISHSFGSFAAIFYLNCHPNSAIKKVVTLASPGKVTDFFNFWQKELSLSNKAMGLIASEFEIKLGNKIDFFETDKLAKNLMYTALIIHDKGDKETFAEDSIKLHKVWAESKLILTENLGHELKSDLVLTQIIEFLK